MVIGIKLSPFGASNFGAYSCTRYRTGAYKEYTLELYELVTDAKLIESLLRSELIANWQGNSETEIQLRSWVIEQDDGVDTYIHKVAAGSL